MGIITKVKLEGGAKLRKRLNKMDPASNFAILRRSISEVAVKISSDARENQLLKGRGRVHDSKLTNRSFTLRNSIGVDLRALPKFAEVGTDLKYAARHEFGLDGFPVRAFMEPAFEKISPQVPAIIVKHWKREAGL